MGKAKTTRRDCQWCGTRLLIVRGVPPLNWGQDPAGKVAVTIADPRTGRFLRHGEDPGPLEHRHSVHECDGTRRKAQRGQWTSAQAAHARQGRRRRTQPAQPTLGPGIGRYYPGRNHP